MKSFQTLVNAGSLRGYLRAENAPPEVIGWAQAIIDAEIARAGEQSLTVRGSPPPSAAELAEKITIVSKTAPSHDESRFDPPETPQPEVNDDTALEVADGAEDAPMSTGGAPRRHFGRGHLKLEASMLPAIREALSAKSFKDVGADYGVTGQSIINFLIRHGVDHKQFKKKTGAPADVGTKASVVVTASKDDSYIGKRAPQKEAVWYPDDWPQVHGMIASGTARETIAADYGVTVGQLEEFIAINTKDEGDSPGESRVPGNPPVPGTKLPAMRTVR